MEDEVYALRRDEAVRLLLPLFFVSGATGLVWQTVWARELHLLFGTSTFAIATVLSAFMGGLALGGFAGGAWADRVQKPLVAYGVMEILIGVYAAAFPWIVEALAPAYLGLARGGGMSPIAFGAVQGLLVGAALLFPTSLMGATLPILARFATDRLGAAGDRVARLYAVNTAGALVGTAICGFWMLPYLGKAWTTWLSAGANVGLGVVAVLLAAWSEGAERAKLQIDVPVEPLGARGLRVAVALALAGFASLVYEVAWTRLLVLTCGASVYAFTVMLLAFLAGIAGGGRLGGPLADRLYQRGGGEAVVLALAAVEIGVGTLAYGLLWLFPEVPILYVRLFDWVDASEWPGLAYVASLGVSGLVMTPPAVLMGAAFPLAVRAVTVTDGSLAAPVGRIYGANTLGSVLGAALAGFVLLPTLWVRGTVLFAVGVNLLAAGVLLTEPSASRRRDRRALIGAIAVLAPLASGLLVVPPWDPLWMTSGLYKYADTLGNHSRKALWEASVDRFELLYYAEGLSSVVTVAKNRKTGNLWLANNGKIDASTSSDMPTQVLVALLPFQFREPADDTLVIGLASGITVGAAAQVPDVRRLEVVELEEAMPPAARLFDDHNHRVLDDPRLSLFANDGRNHVLLAAPGSYDLVISEPSNPWLTGVSNLFTREFLEIGRSRLKAGGVWAQWVQMYGMGTRDLRTLMRTFAEVYPHAAVFATIQDADLVIVGSEAPLSVDPARARGLLARGPGVREELARVGLHDEIDLMSTWVMDRDGMLAFAGDVPLNTDDNLLIEYSAPLHLYQTTSEANMERLLSHAEVPVDAVGGDPVQLLRLARAYLRRDDFDRSLLAGIAAMERIAAADPDPRASAAAAAAAEAGPERFDACWPALEQVVEAAKRRPEPPDEVIRLFLDWQVELDEWSRE